MSVIAVTVATAVTLGAPNMPTAYKDVAQQYHIPPAVLWCLCLQESGLVQDDGTVIPWPWTLNVDGEGLRFPNQSEAFAALERALAAGASVDVGLSQINHRWHHQRFNSLREMLDPWINLNVAAQILREQAVDSHTWFDAVGRYHAPNHPNRARKYADKAYQRCINWQERQRA